MRIPRRAELGLLLGSVLLTVTALEVAIRAGWIPFPTYVASSGWRREHWLRERAEGRAVTRHHRIDRHDPLLGWTLIEGLAGVEVAGGRVHSNSKGMRSRREYPLEPGPGLRVVALGDSFTFGQCVDDAETFAARLEARLAPGEVLNLAVHGHGHDQQLLRLRETGLPHRPDVVLLGFLNADVERNQLDFRDYAKPRFRLRGGELALRNVPIPHPDALAAGFQLRSRNYAEMLFDTLFAKRLERRNRKVTEAILRAIVADAEGIGARAAFVYLPSENQSRAGRADPSRTYRHVCEEGRVLCIDPTPRLHAFLAGEDDPSAHFRCHYSPELHALVAEEIAAAFEREGVRPRRR